MTVDKFIGNTRGTVTDYIPCSTTRQRSDGVGIRLQRTDKTVERNLESDPISIAKGAQALDSIHPRNKDRNFATKES